MIRNAFNIGKKLYRSGRMIAKFLADGREPNERIDHLKILTLPNLKALGPLSKRIEKMEGKWKAFDRHRAANYDTFKLLTYYIDKEFTVEQKKWFIEKHFYRALGYFPQLDNPRSFNEKTQWYKLNYRDPLMTDLIDKYRFKEKIAEIIGPEYVVPLLGVWDRGADIDFESLPKSFVLKSNWGSGSRHVLLVKDKDALDFDQVRYKASNWMQPWENVYYHTFDWGYKDIQPKIIAEELLSDKSCEYNFFCFNGEPEYCCAITGGAADGAIKRRSYFNKDWDFLPFTKLSRKPAFYVERPNNYDEMLAIAKEVSKPFPHARVDFMQSERGLFVAEITFYTGSGTGRFYPTEWDYKFGEAFVLPKANVR